MNKLNKSIQKNQGKLMLNKLNLPPLAVFLFAPGEKHFGRGMQDDLRLDSQPAFNSDFN